MKRASSNGSTRIGTWKTPAKASQQTPTMQQRAEHVREQAKRFSLDEVVKRLTKRPT